METTATTKPQSKWLLALSLIIAAGLLYLALRKVSWSELVSTLRQGNLALLALGVAILSLSCVVRALRWRVLLSAEKTLPLPMVFWATMTGYLGNAYLPARAGEVVRSVLIGQKGGLSKSFTLATALTERLVDALILVVIAAIGVSTLFSLPGELTQAVRLMGVVGALGAVALLAAPHMGGFANNLIARLPVSTVLRGKIEHFTTNFLTGAGALQNWSRLALFMVFSLGIWTLDMLCGLSVARAFGLNLGPFQVFILLAALGLASALPSTPGYVGVYQFVAVAVLVPFGLSEAQSLAYILGYQGVNYVVITLWGLIGLWKLRGGFRLR